MGRSLSYVRRGIERLGPFPITFHASIGMNDGNNDRDGIHGVMDGEGSRIEGSSSPLQGIGGPMTRLGPKKNV